MNIGPLEYLVIGLPDNQFTSEILPELTSIKEKGVARVVDLLFLNKDAEGKMTRREIHEQSPEELVGYGSIKDDLLGLLNEADIEQLTSNIPSNTSAVIVVLEHIWVLGLTAAISRAGE